MKSRIKVAPKTILAYNLDNAKILKLEQFCSDKAVNLKSISIEQANLQIGYLLEFSGFSVNNEKCDNPPEDECLVFSGFDRQALNEIISQLRQNDIIVTLKAVCTPSNQSWNVKDLITHLCAEHKTMNRDV